MYPAQDEAAIRRIVADAQTAFNTNDADLLTEHFAADATVVTATGIRFLRPDVALAYTQASATTEDGEPIDLDHSMVALGCPGQGRRPVVGRRPAQHAGPP